MSTTTQTIPVFSSQAMTYRPPDEMERDVANEEDEPQPRRRRSGEQFELLITFGAFVTMGAMVLVGIWVVSNAPPGMQVIAQGMLAGTILLAFGQVLLLLKAKLLHRDVSDDLNETKRVGTKQDRIERKVEKTYDKAEKTYDKVNGPTEKLISTLREEHRAEVHKLEGRVGSLMLAKELLESEKADQKALIERLLSQQDATQKRSDDREDAAAGAKPREDA